MALITAIRTIHAFLLIATFTEVDTAAVAAITIWSPNIPTVVTKKDVTAVAPML